MAKRAKAKCSSHALGPEKGPQQSEPLHRSVEGRLIHGLLSLAQSLSSERALGARLTDLCRTTVELVGCDRSSIFLREGEYYRAMYNYGNPPDIAMLFPKHKVSLRDPLIARAMETRNFVMVNDAPNSSLMDADTAKVARIQSIVIAPLLDRSQQPLGFVTAEYNENPGSFTDMISTLVLGFAKLAEMAVMADRQDVERKRAEEALRESEERVQRLSAATFEGILIHDEGRILDANEQYARMLGYDVAEVTGMHVLDFTAPESRELVSRNIKSRYENPYEHLALRKDGSVFPVEVRRKSVPYRGRAVGVATVLDITERKRAEEALRESEHKLRQVIDGLGPYMLVGLMTPSGTLIEANRPALEIAGLKADEVLGKPFWEAYWWSYSESVQKQLREAIERAAAGDSSRYDVAVRAADGQFITIDFCVQPLLDDQGEVKYLVPSAVDITERKKAEETLQSYADRLQVMHEIDQAILAARSPEAICEAALTRIGRLLPGHSAGIVAFEPEDREARMLAISSEAKKHARAGTRLPEGIFGEIETLRRGEIDVVDDVLAANVPTVEIEALGAGDVRSFVRAPMIFADELIGCLCVGAGEPAAFSAAHAEIAREIADELAVAIQGSRLLHQVEAARGELEGLSRRLLEVQEAERREIARELHDEVGQLLTGLKLVLEMKGRSSDGEAGTELSEAQELVDELMSRVRELSLDLRPSMLDDLGLLPALRWHFQRYESLTGVHVDFRHTGLDRRFAPEVETAVYRIVQEGLTNVARHSGAKEASVRVWADRDNLGVQIEDEGHGFVRNAGPTTTGGSGLAGMRERAVLLGGNLRLSLHQEPALV